MTAPAWRLTHQSIKRFTRAHLWARAMDPGAPLAERDRAAKELRARVAEVDGLEGWLVVTAALADALYETPGPGWVERIERCKPLTGSRWP
jgi:hypothetical protein